VVLGWFLAERCRDCNRRRFGLADRALAESAGSGATERRSEAEARTRLKHGIEALRFSLVHNKKELASVVGIFSQKKVPFDTGLDVAGWEASRDEIVPFLKRPDLQRRIAFLFARLDTFARLNSMYLDLAVGTGSTIGGAKGSRDVLRSYLETLAKELGSEIDAVSAELNTVIAAKASA
jgi:hypothetical protein